MKQTIEGFQVYNLTNEYQIYDSFSGLVRRVWKSGDKYIDQYRINTAIAELMA